MKKKEEKKQYSAEKYCRQKQSGKLEVGKSSVMEVCCREDPKNNDEGIERKRGQAGLGTAEFRISKTGYDEVFNMYVR